MALTEWSPIPSERKAWHAAVDGAQTLSAILPLLDPAANTITAAEWRYGVRPSLWAGWTEGTHTRVMAAQVLRTALTFVAAWPRLRSEDRKTVARAFAEDARQAMLRGGRWGRPSEADIAEVEAVCARIG